MEYPLGKEGSGVESSWSPCHGAGKWSGAGGWRPAPAAAQEGSFEYAVRVLRTVVRMREARPQFSASPNGGVEWGTRSGLKPHQVAPPGCDARRRGLGAGNRAEGPIRHGETTASAPIVHGRMHGLSTPSRRSRMCVLVLVVRGTHPIARAFFFWPWRRRVSCRSWEETYASRICSLSRTHITGKSSWKAIFTL